MAQSTSDTPRMEPNGAATHQLKGHAGDVAADIDELRKDMAKFAGALGKVAKSRADQAGHQVGKLSAQLRDQAGQRAADVGEQVRARPLAAVGISLGVGLLLGMALHATRGAREIRIERRKPYH